MTERTPPPTDRPNGPDRTPSGDAAPAARSPNPPPGVEAPGGRIHRRRLFAVVAATAATSALGGIAAIRAVAPEDPTPPRPGPPEVPREQTLVLLGAGDGLGRFEEPGWVNPFLLGAGRAGEALAFEPLAFADPALGAVRPWLAESWDYDPGALALAIRLRHGAAWSDGSPVVADDVVATLTLLLDAGRGEDATAVRGAPEVARAVRAVTAPDERTVRLEFNVPAPRFFERMLTYGGPAGLPIVPAHVWRDKDPRAFGNRDAEREWPVVTGPYALSEANDDRRVWDRRDGWWAAAAGVAPLPAPRRLVFRPAAEDSRMAAALGRGDADASAPLAPPTLATLRAAASPVADLGARPVPQAPAAWPVLLGFNARLYPFEETAVRRALGLALDRDRLAAVAGGVPAAVPFPLDPGLGPGLDPVRAVAARSPLGRFDPERAGDLLAGAGFARGDAGSWERDGTPLRVVVTAEPAWGELAAEVAALLREAGWDADHRLPTDAPLRLRRGSASVYLHRPEADPRDPYPTLARYHGRYAASTGTPTPHYSRWSDPEFDATVDRLATLDPSDPAFGGVVGEALARWLREAPEVPLLYPDRGVPVATTYWQGWPGPSDAYADPAFWHRGFLNVLTRLEPA